MLKLEQNFSPEHDWACRLMPCWLQSAKRPWLVSLSIHFSVLCLKLGLGWNLACLQAHRSYFSAKRFIFHRFHVILETTHFLGGIKIIPNLLDLQWHCCHWVVTLPPPTFHISAWTQQLASRLWIVPRFPSATSLTGSCCQLAAVLDAKQMSSFSLQFQMRCFYVISYFQPFFHSN